MSRTIFLYNKSNHPQTFEIHGWNNNRNITVGAHDTVRINAPDHTSGAIIALHDGHEGEQAEITKDGFGGNDFIDLSNIVGAGGNMTVGQVGSPDTLKGDPNFMQDLNKAWHKASPQTRHNLRNLIHLDKAGNVVRMDEIKGHEELENFVRSFANGMTYIGNGAWGGDPGNPNDNKQSSAAHGNKDIIVTYNDGNADPGPGHRALALAAATPHKYNVANGDTLASVAHRFGTSVDDMKAANPDADPTDLKTGESVKLPVRHDNALFMSLASESPSTYAKQTGDTSESIAHRFGLSVDQLKKANPNVDPEKLNDGEKIHLTLNNHSVSTENKDERPGIELSNKSNRTCTYYFYENLWNGNGTAGANFNKPFTHITLGGGHSEFVSLPASFKGRVQRGTQIPCTWAEFQLEASNDHGAHGDISVEQGNDGGAWIRSTKDPHVGAGFTGDIEKWGTPDAYQVRPDKVRALASTMGNWMGPPNKAAIKCQQWRIGRTVYVVGGTGVPDVASSNKRLAVEFD